MLCDWLPPDFGAVGQYAVRFAEELAVAGHQVTLVGLSSTGSSQCREVNGAGFLLIKRAFRPTYDKQSLGGRAWWTLLTNLRLLWHARSELRAADEIRFTGSPPFMLHFVMPLSALFGRRTRYRITDFHPECLIAEYERVPTSLRLLHRLTLFWRRRVSTIEVLGEDQRRICIAQGIEARRIELVRDPSPIRFSGCETQSKPPETLVGRKIVLYSGNWGIAHDLDTFVAAASAFEARHPGCLGVWLNATGSRAAPAHDALITAGVACSYTRPVRLSELAGVLLAADLHLICLRNSFVGYVLPSKVYACIESGRPILFIGSEQSDVHALCTTAAAAGKIAYRRVEVGVATDGVDALEDLLLQQRELKVRQHNTVRSG